MRKRKEDGPLGHGVGVTEGLSETQKLLMTLLSTSRRKKGGRPAVDITSSDNEEGEEKGEGEQESEANKVT